MRNLWKTVALGLTLFFSSFAAENVYNIPDDFYAELESYRVTEESYPTV